MLPPSISSGPLSGPRRPTSRRRSWLYGVSWCVCSLLATAAAAAPSEYQVKAAFLFSFTKFVDWPPDRFSSPDDPIVIAVLGRNPFGDGLETLVRDRRVDGRPLVVRSLPTAEQARASGLHFHLLFVPAGAEAQFESLVRTAPRVRALTVGESHHFTSLGGMVTFVVVEDKIRFEINRAAAAAAGVKLSAQLQKLAVPPSAPAAGSVP